LEIYNNELKVDKTILENYQIAIASLVEYIEGIKFLTIRSNLGAILISYDVGTDTREFVKQVMRWANESKKADLFDNEIFSKIDKANNTIIEFFSQPDHYDYNNFHTGLVCVNKHLRDLIKELSVLCDVEIEPKIASEFIEYMLDKVDLSYVIVPGGMR
jgi:hypothetical protein